MKFPDTVRPKFADSDEPALSDFREGTVAWYIQRRIDESRQRGARPLGLSHYWILRCLQKDPIGKKFADRLKPSDLIEHCRARKAGVYPRYDRPGRPVQPQTVRQDLTYLRSLIRHYVILEDLSPEALGVFVKAGPILEKEQLVGKGEPRSRRPTQEEIDRILAYIDTHEFEIPMRALVEFSLLTARRISESCRLRWDDVDADKRTCVVRDLKNPKGKGFHGEFPLLGRAWDIVQEQPKVNGKPWIFTHDGHQIRAASVSAAYTRIKKALGIKNLRLHDNRRECASRLFEAGYNVPEVQTVTQHRNPQLLLKVYTKIDPASLHNGPASKRTHQGA